MMMVMLAWLPLQRKKSCRWAVLICPAGNKKNTQRIVVGSIFAGETSRIEKYYYPQRDNWGIHMRRDSTSQCHAAAAAAHEDVLLQCTFVGFSDRGLMTADVGRI